MLKKFILPSLFLLSGWLFGQKAAIQGTVTDAEGRNALANASVVLEKTGLLADTDDAGMFVLKNVPSGEFVLVVSKSGYSPVERTLKVKKGAALVVDISLKKDPTTDNSPNEIPTVSLDEAEEQTESQGEVANLLHASRDIFQQLSGNAWSNFRFRERGYSSENFPVFLNGVSINDPETGRAFFGEFGGLNDVLRNRESVVGIDASEFAFGEIGGATRIDTRASVQRKTKRASYASTNRNYRNRLMLTYNTGLLPRGWALSLSASRRWAQEGYVPGTFFVGTSYFASVDKKIGFKHGFNVTVFGAPSTSGRSGDTFEEMYKLAGSHYYNPNWGYQNGVKRNAAVSHSNQPMAMFRYDWTPNIKSNLTVGTYVQAGKRGSSRLNWNRANNPAADYYKRLPSAQTDSTQSQAWATTLSGNEGLRQIDWDGMFAANRHNMETITNPITGASVTGNRSEYIVEDNIQDSKEAGLNLTARRTISSRVVLNGGANYQYYQAKNYKIVKDLLGGDYWYDYSRFAASDNPTAALAGMSDIQNPYHTVKKGEVFGYNFDENIRKSGAWLQAQVALKRMQLFAGAEVGQTGFWRIGNYKNGIFQSTSLGESAKLNFNTYGAKAGLTYKLNGRNYLYTNGFIGTRAPQFNDIFVAPRLRNDLISGVTVSSVKSVEGGYYLRAPYYKARLTGYMTQFEKETDSYQLLLQSENEFGSVNIRGINRQHTGIEAAFEAKPPVLLQWSFTAAASVGKYIYTNRPLMSFALSNTDAYLLQNDTVYQENYYVSNTPQSVYNFGVKYESKRFWFATLTFNYRDNFWFDFDETRHTTSSVRGIEKDSDAWKTILKQEKADAAYTLDFFGGKSWRIKYKYFINLTLGVNNILNNQNIVSAGKDSYQRSFKDLSDVRRYTTERIYAPGTNYFISIAVRK